MHNTDGVWIRSGTSIPWNTIFYCWKKKRRAAFDAKLVQDKEYVHEAVHISWNRRGMQSEYHVGFLSMECERLISTMKCQFAMCDGRWICLGRGLQFFYKGVTQFGEHLVRYSVLFHQLWRGMMGKYISQKIRCNKLPATDRIC